MHRFPQHSRGAAACVVALSAAAWGQNPQNPKVVDAARRAPPVLHEQPGLIALLRGVVLPAAIRDLGSVSTPALDVPLLLAQDRAAIGGPLRAGVVQDVHATSARDGQWMPLADQGWLWTLRLRVGGGGAAAMRVLFENWPPPPGCEVFLYDAIEPTESFGPYSHSSPIAPGDFWSPIVFAGDAYVEYFVPASQDHRAAASQLRIESVVNQYRGTPFGDDGGLAELGCHIDVTCVPEAAVAASGVGALAFVSQPFSFFCSGSMVNRALGDFSPLFMTAAHCIAGTTIGGSVLVVWFYQTSARNGAPPTAGLPQTRSRGLLSRDESHDVALLGLDIDIPAGVQFNGIDGTGAGFASPAAAYCISHPDGSYKRFAVGLKVDEDGACDSGTGYYVLNLNQGNGRLEPGSSGGPMFDANHHVRSVVACGVLPVCTGDQFVNFGRLDHAWSVLHPWLDPPEPVYVNVAYNGLPQGTFTAPMKTIVQGVCAVRPDGHLWLLAGGSGGTHTVPSVLTIDRPMTIHAHSNPVTIQIATP